MKKLLIIFFTLCLTLMSVDNVGASDTAYKTYTMSPQGEKIETQTAYEAIDVLSSESFGKIEDILIKDGSLYLVDSLNKSVHITNLSGNNIKSFGSDVLEEPSGIALDSDNNIFVADRMAESIFKFNQEGILDHTYDRPTEPLFGKKEFFKPTKISIDIKDNLYVVGEGASNGIIEMNYKGSFLGYFGPNQSEVSIFQQFKDKVMSEIQRSNILMNRPPAPNNINIDDKGIVYTVTSSSKRSPIKKLNVSGKNLFENEIYTGGQGIDLVLGSLNNVFVLSNNGKIVEYTSDGEVLFEFGAIDSNSQRNGLYRNPTGLALDNKGVIYVADGDFGVIHRLKPSDFANEVHKGLALFEEGYYLESAQYWSKVTDMNGSFALAQTAMGHAYSIQEDYDKSMIAFKKANNKAGYSDSFWEIRHEWMETNLAYWIAGVLLLVFIERLTSRLSVRKKMKTKLVEIQDMMLSIKIISEIVLLFNVIKHPIDTYYEIKKNKKASVLSSSFWYLVLLLEFIFFQYGVAYLFNSQAVFNTHIAILVAIVVSGIVLFISVNYAVSTITDGEAHLYQLMIGTVYAMAPLIIGIIPLILISQILTINETFIFNYGMVLLLGWSLVYLFIMIKEFHNYSFKETVKNILITAVSIFIVVAVFSIVFIIFKHGLSVVQEIVKEVTLRV